MAGIGVNRVGYCHLNLSPSHLKEYFQQGGDPNAQSDDGVPLLLQLANSENYDGMALTLEQPSIKTGVRDKNLRTVLQAILAVSKEPHIDFALKIAQQVINGVPNREPYVNFQDRNHESALSIVLEQIVKGQHERSLEKLRFLLNNGASLANDRTAKHWVSIATEPRANTITDQKINEAIALMQNPKAKEEETVDPKNHNLKYTLAHDLDRPIDNLKKRTSAPPPNDGRSWAPPGDGDFSSSF